jgi:hypothetical protein
MHESQPLAAPLGEVMPLEGLLAPVGAFKVRARTEVGVWGRASNP